MTQAVKYYIENHKEQIENNSLTLVYFDCPNHFDRTYKRFQDVVTVYKCGLNYM